MAQSTMTYVLSYIKQIIPSEILQLAFKPRKYNTTVEQRIISEIIEGPILLDTNLVGGKRREIVLNSTWEMINLPYDNNSSLLGTGLEGSFYLIPAEAREYRNISSVVGITPSVSSTLPGASMNGSGSFGNTATGMLSQMLNSRTMAQYPIMPQITLEGTNIIRFYPQQLIDQVAVSVMLEFDAEFINMNTSSIVAMRNLCLCAVQRYIATKLRVSIDETEVVAGMEIGIVKDLVVEYMQKGEQYNDLLIKLKGALTFDPQTFSRLAYYAL